MPAEIRTRPSPRPSAARRSGGTEAWVIDAGWPMSDSTPPRLSASAKIRTRSTTRRAALGLGDGLVRISAGIEDVADLMADLTQALEG